MRRSTTGGMLLICLVMITVTATAGNLLRNGGAEDADACPQWGAAALRNTEIKRTGAAAFELDKKYKSFKFEDKNNLGVTSPELIPVDSGKSYYLEAYLKSVDPEKPASAYFGLLMYDKDKRPINWGNVHVIPGTETELAANADKGAVSVMVVDAGKWPSGDYHAIAFNVRSDLSDLPNFDISPNIAKIEKKDGRYEVTLKAPLKESYPAGTKIREHSSYDVPLFWVGDGWVPNDWKRYVATIGGEAAFGIPVNMFWKGTRFVRVFVQLGNYNRIPQDGARLLADDIVFAPAAERLDVNGSFLGDGFPAGWSPDKPDGWDEEGKVSLDKISGTGINALRLASQTKAMRLLGKRCPVAMDDKITIKAAMRGKGVGVLGIYAYPGGAQTLREFKATEGWTEFAAEIPIAKPDIKEVCVVIGVEKGAAIDFIDVSAVLNAAAGVAAEAAYPPLPLPRPSPTAYPVFPLPQAPAMDGKWDGGAWKDIPAATGFMSTKTGQFVTTRQTAFKMGWFGGSLYVAVKCDEPQPDKIKADPDNYRNGWYPDDNIEFFFSADKASKEFKQFVTNSRGARWSNCTAAVGVEPWQAVSHKGADFWSVEVRIPFPQLGVGDDFKARQFGFNLARAANDNPDSEKYSCFAPVDLKSGAFADVNNFPLLAFKDAPAPEQLAAARKDLDRQANWICDRCWRIGFVTESFLRDMPTGQQTGIDRFLDLKRQARKLFETKSFSGALELFKQYEERAKSP